MTYIEFFDKVASENISACLTYAPQRVVYIGDSAKIMKRHIAHYQRVFADRGETIEFLYRTVSKSNLEHAVTVLTELVNTYDDCVFDITGGEEILTLALGIVYERNRDKNIQIHKFNLRSNTVHDCDKDGTTIYRDAPALSIEENVRIYGGDIAYGTVTQDKTYLWELDPDFIRDVEAIWTVCRGNVRLWNAQIGVFEAAEAVGCVSEDGLTTTVSVSRLETYLAKRRASYKLVPGIVNYLYKQGLLTAIREDASTLTISYKDPQVKKCLTKAGQALEMKVFLTARGLADENGALVYQDALNGVVIDWDGEDEQYDTTNEIDILLMHGMIPVFFSCKNGIVTADELYKLNTVAERFGGQYAKKVLVATALDTIGEAGAYLRQRARDMNISVIENVQELNDWEFSRKLMNLWCN